MPHSPPNSDANEDDVFDGPSKTQRKREMEALQDVGKQLTELSRDQLKRVPVSDRLRDAVQEMSRITKNEAKRRHLQFIGRLMRDEEVEPILAVLEAFRGNSRAENARLHRLEDLRTRFMEDETVLTEIGNAHPGADLTRLRQLRRNAVKELAESRPPRAFREIFRMLRELDSSAREAPDEETGDEANDE
ncbi:MAG: ribosome biogenesis factor YjgA [Moraxellaceae bacterium]|nr:ribosome biogenesis factor YjgA [Moraxellaceae bacterium]